MTSRILVTREEAAKMLSMSLSLFERRVQPELRLVRVGSRVYVSVQELERWVAESATLAPGSE